MANKYVHYQDYFKSFLGGWTFENGDEVLTIKEIKEEQMYDANTGGNKSGLCLYFEEKELPMVLNVTNAETIASIVGSDKLEDWKGKRIIVGQSKIKAFGKEQLAIRVRNQVPKEATAKKATEAQIETIESLIASGAISNRDAMLKHFGIAKLEDISEEDAAELIKIKTNTAGF